MNPQPFLERDFAWRTPMSITQQLLQILPRG